MKADRKAEAGAPAPRAPSGPAAGKTRADQALVDRGLAESRTRAQALILAGKVFSGEARVDKPGQPVKPIAPGSREAMAGPQPGARAARPGA